MLVEPASDEKEWETILDTSLLKQTIECLDDRGLHEHRLKETLSDEFEGIKTIIKERENHEEFEAPNTRRKSKIE